MELVELELESVGDFEELDELESDLSDELEDSELLEDPVDDDDDEEEDDELLAVSRLSLR